MCTAGVIPLAGLAISAAGAVASYQGQQQAADAQETANATNALNAAQAARHEHNALEEQRRQVEENAAKDSFDLTLETLRAASSAEASAADAGVSGFSVDALMRDIYATGGRAQQNIASGLHRRQDQITREQAGVRTRQAIRSQGQPVNRPSPLGLAIDLGAAGVDYASARTKRP